MRRGVLVVILLVLLSGCFSVIDTGGTPAETPTESPPRETTTTPAETPTESPPRETTKRPTATPTPRPPQNPWRTDQVTVAVTNGSEKDHDAVQTAIKFWRARDDTGVPYTLNLSLASTPKTADIVISVRDRIRECYGERTNGTFYWCGPLLSSETVPENTERVEIAGGYNQSSTVTIMKAAIGHLYGIDSPTDRSDVDEFDTLRPDDPFYTEPPVVVGINNTASPDRNFTPLVRETLEWWESQPDVNKNYSTTFHLRPNVSDPDIEVQFVEQIPPGTCSVEPHEDVLGCADRLSGQYFVEDVLVRIETGYTNASTLQTLKHELGHIHGRRHNQSPMPLMSPTGDDTLLPQPNVTERALPWRSSNLTYYLASRSSDRIEEQYVEQVNHAVDYYNSGAEGYVPQNLTLTRTQNRSAADIVITEEKMNASREAGSNINRIGYSTDNDPAWEYYTSYEIILTELETDRYGWYVGYWFGFAFGAENISKLPPPFDEPKEDPREDWWP